MVRVKMQTVVPFNTQTGLPYSVQHQMFRCRCFADLPIVLAVKVMGLWLAWREVVQHPLPVFYLPPATRQLHTYRRTTIRQGKKHLAATDARQLA